VAKSGDTARAVMHVASLEAYTWDCTRVDRLARVRVVGALQNSTSASRRKWRHLDTWGRRFKVLPFLKGSGRVEALTPGAPTLEVTVLRGDVIEAVMEDMGREVRVCAAESAANGWKEPEGRRRGRSKHKTTHPLYLHFNGAQEKERQTWLD